MTTLVDVFNLIKGRKAEVDSTVDAAVNPPAPAPVPQSTTANGTGAAQNEKFLKAKEALDKMTPQQMEQLRARLAKERLAKIAAAQAAQAAQQQVPPTQ